MLVIIVRYHVARCGRFLDKEGVMHDLLQVAATEDYVPAAATIAKSLEYSATIMLFVVAVVILLLAIFRKRVEHEQADRNELEYEVTRSHTGA